MVDQWIELFSVNNDSLELIPITTGQKHWFTLSPDGSEIVYSTIGVGAKIYLINADGSNERVLVDRGAWQFYWSPDNSNIFYCACSATETNIGLIQADSTDHRLLVEDARGGVWLDESTILFSRVTRSEAYTISQIAIDGTNEVDLVDHGSFMSSSMELSPDRKYIPYLGDCTSDYMCDIFVMELGKKNPVNITKSPGY